MNLKLYRVVSVQELADLKQRGELRPGPFSMEGKWFAENPDNAREWGRRLYQAKGEFFQVVEIEIPDQVADQMFRVPNLDQIGPARYADLAQLAVINRTMGPLIREIYWNPAGGL